MTFRVQFLKNIYVYKKIYFIYAITDHSGIRKKLMETLLRRDYSRQFEKQIRQFKWFAR